MADGDGDIDPSRVFSTYTDSTTTQSTVILGAGIIGCATAYYLSHSGNTKPDTIHVIESAPELFASASGKAAGFCVSDWFGPRSASLGELSFRLHQELANEHDGRKNWGYSRSSASSLALGAGGAVIKDADATGPEWLTRRRGDWNEAIGAEGGVAQVDPMRLSQFLLRQSVLKGVRLHHPAKPVRISRDTSGDLSAIRVKHENGTDHKIPCTRLLITCGAWTSSVFRELFPASTLHLGISQLAGHSLVVKSPRWSKDLEDKGCHAIFTSWKNGISPEVFSRVGEEIYIAGVNDPSIPLPDKPTDAKVDPASMNELNKIAQRLLETGEDGAPSDLEVVREALCFRPVTRTGEPILARVPDGQLGGIKTKTEPDGGVFVAAGHGPWGISHSLGSGKVMADVLEGEDPSADVSGLGLQ